MKRVILLLLLLIFYSRGVYSQQVSIGFQLGTGTYSMSQLKTINDLVKHDLPFDTKTVANFPPFLNYSAAFLIRTGIVNTGLVYTFQSTGSRVSGKDYSGEYRFDMVIYSSAPGIYCAIDLLQQDKLLISFYSVFGTLFSNLKTSEFLRIQETRIMDETLKFKDFNFFAEPGFYISRPVKFLNIGFNAGYSIQFGNQSFYYRGNKNIKLVNPVTGNPVKPGWNGLRAGLSAFYTF
jgi:hypothetical protein